MEFTEIWLQGIQCLVNAEYKQANKCSGIFNRHLIALNIEQNDYNKRDSLHKCSNCTQRMGAY